MSLTIVTLRYPEDKFWGDGWKLHATGCRALLRNEIDWQCKVDSLEQAVYTAFGDFIGEDMSYRQALNHLHVCACAKKEVNA